MLDNFCSKIIPIIATPPKIDVYVMPRFLNVNALNIASKNSVNFKKAIVKFIFLFKLNFKNIYSPLFLMNFEIKLILSYNKKVIRTIF